MHLDGPCLDLRGWRLAISAICGDGRIKLHDNPIRHSASRTSHQLGRSGIRSAVRQNGAVGQRVARLMVPKEQPHRKPPKATLKPSRSEGRT